VIEICFKKEDLNKPKSCRSCVIVNCESLKRTASGYCYDCDKYPCTRLMQLDRRYRTKYGMSMVDNLSFIREHGMIRFLNNQEIGWTCKVCGSGLSVHRGFCLNCKAELRRPSS
jgi:hypothetical protein